MYTLLKWKQAKRESLLTKAECLMKSGWKLLYDGLPLCLVCMQVIDMMKEYNVKRRFETQHKMHYEEYYGKT